jgi:uncharacterized protein (DUF4415 family)
MTKLNPDTPDHESPELDDAFFARAKPAAEVLGAEFVAKARRGRPKSLRPKTEVKIRLDADVTEHLRGTGEGWQTRLNAFLADAIKAKRL